MKILIACEFSGIVREAFKLRGHDAWSCDLLPTEIPGQHIQGDVLKILGDKWDGMICHPPCKRIAASGARWWKDYPGEQETAIIFAQQLACATWIPLIALENPIGVLSRPWPQGLGKPTQIIQPWQFGHGETKATCLWLKGFKPLIPTNIVEGRAHRVHREPPSPERSKNRSRTFQGIANAMSEQWGV